MSWIPHIERIFSAKGLLNLKLTEPSLASLDHVFGSCVRALREVLPPVQIVDLPAGMTCQIPGPDCLHQQHAPIASCLGATGSQGRPFAAVSATLFTDRLLQQCHRRSPSCCTTVLLLEATGFASRYVRFEQLLELPAHEERYLKRHLTIQYLPRCAVRTLNFSYSAGLGAPYVRECIMDYMN